MHEFGSRIGFMVQGVTFEVKGLFRVQKAGGLRGVRA